VGAESSLDEIGFDVILLWQFCAIDTRRWRWRGMRRLTTPVIRIGVGDGGLENESYLFGLRGCCLDVFTDRTRPTDCLEQSNLLLMIEKPNLPDKRRGAKLKPARIPAHNL